MAKKGQVLPAELSAFIKAKETTLHCDDGDWELNIQARDDSDFKEDLPARSTVIAENGSGDCLFLKTSLAGKLDPKVFVYWHEEERSEIFSNIMAALVAMSAKNKAAAAKKGSKPAAAKGNKLSATELAALEKKLFDKDWEVRRDARGKFKESAYGLEALPMLRRVLAADDVDTVIFAANCIGQLGPEAATCEVGEARETVAVAHVDRNDLTSQLEQRGAQKWNYSGYSNCYSACLDALVKLEYEPDYLLEFVQTHIGLSEDDFIDSLEALEAIGTKDAADLAKRGLAFWLPELNMSQAKKAKALVGSIGKKKKK